MNYISIFILNSVTSAPTAAKIATKTKHAASTSINAYNERDSTDEPNIT